MEMMMPLNMFCQENNTFSVINGTCIQVGKLKVTIWAKPNWLKLASGNKEPK